MKKTLALILTLSFVLLALAGCSGTDINEADTGKDNYTLTVGTIKGPTGMGMAKLIKDNEASGKYEVSLFNDATEISAKLLGKQLDIAAVPVNLAAVVNKKTDGAYIVAAVNTLGVLYVMENGSTINSVSDLEGKTIHAYGQGATPEYMLNHILAENGLEGKVTVEWYPDPATLSSQAASGAVDIIMLPEPQITVAMNKNESLRIAIDITAEWEKCGDGKAVQGCIVVKKEIAEKYPEALNAFLDEYKASVDYVNENKEDASSIIAELGIVPAAPVALKAIPRCNIVFIEGDEMISALNTMYAVLFAANPASVGGTLPDATLYYKR